MSSSSRQLIPLLDWNRRASWEPAVRRGLACIAGKEYVERLRQRTDAFNCADDSGPVLDVLGVGAEAEVSEAIWSELSKDFTHFAGYHACRTENVNEYYDNGLVPLAAEEVRAKFRRMFTGSPHFVEPAALDAAIAGVSTDTRDGNVHVALDDRALLHDCGHYLIYGGEYLQALAENVPDRGPELREALRESGRATILCCHLPVMDIPERENLIGRMVAQHVYWVTHEDSDPTQLDFTVTLRRRVPPSAIKSHCHPPRIRDPHAGKVWNDATRAYEAEG